MEKFAGRRRALAIRRQRLANELARMHQMLGDHEAASQTQEKPRRLQE
jgi:hypothetical protein